MNVLLSLDTLADCFIPDYGPIPKLQRVRQQDRQVWNEVWYRESDSTAGVVSRFPQCAARLS